MFNSIIDNTTNSLSILSVLICMLSAIILGIIIAITHMKTGKYTKNFVITLSILPLLVNVVIVMVNGNLGTSVAVMGAFSLVRFRSIPGNSKEITSIFLAMAIGLALGMGQVLFSFIFTIISCLALFVLYKTKFGDIKETNKRIKILIPENLDYTNIFDEEFNKYTKSVVLEKSKTTNMGSLYELVYIVDLKDIKNEKEFIDKLRCKNGNLAITVSRAIDNIEL